MLYLTTRFCMLCVLRESTLSIDRSIEIEIEIDLDLDLACSDSQKVYL